jgi:hypothetical protein
VIARLAAGQQMDAARLEGEAEELAAYFFDVRGTAAG